MEDVIISLLNHYGYLGVMLLIAIENIFPPIPSEVILTFSGFMTTYTNMKIGLVIFFSTLGSIVGAVLLYLLGRLISKDYLIHLLSGRLGKILFLKPSDIEKSYQWFEKKSDKAVFICRFIPLVRSLISIPAGMAKMSLPNFLAFTSIATLIWNSVLVLLGSLMGKNYGKIINFLEVYKTIFLIILIIIVVIMLLYFSRKRRRLHDK